MSSVGAERCRHARGRWWKVLLPALLLAAAGCNASAAGPEEESPPVLACQVAQPACEARLDLGGGVFLRYYRSFPLLERNVEITEAVIVIHGTDRAAGAAFVNMRMAVVSQDRIATTLIVAPYFQLLEDLPAADEAYWTDGGWKRGHLSVVGGPTPRVSSYAALDRIIARLGDRSRFPNLTRIVVAGHSAGGQVVHRFAAGSRTQDALPAIDFRYIVSNPSTYLYLTPARAAGAGFAVPDTQTCANYDNWHLGMQGLNAYMNAVPGEAVVANLTGRDVRILIGDLDTGSAQLDVSCGANLQGEHRFDRGRTLIRYMDAVFAGHAHREMIVPGVAHSSRQMYTSAVGLQALFGS